MGATKISVEKDMQDICNSQNRGTLEWLGEKLGRPSPQGNNHLTGENY